MIGAFVTSGWVVLDLNSMNNAYGPFENSTEARKFIKENDRHDRILHMFQILKPD